MAWRHVAAGPVGRPVACRRMTQSKTARVTGEATDEHFIARDNGITSMSIHEISSPLQLLPPQVQAVGNDIANPLFISGI